MARKRSINGPIRKMLAAWRKHDASLKTPKPIRTWVTGFVAAKQIPVITRESIPPELLERWGDTAVWAALADRWAILSLVASRDATTYADAMDAYQHGPQDSELTMLLLQKAAHFASSMSETLNILKLMSDCCHGKLRKLFNAA